MHISSYYICDVGFSEPKSRFKRGTGPIAVNFNHMNPKQTQGSWMLSHNLMQEKGFTYIAKDYRLCCWTGIWVRN